MASIPLVRIAAAGAALATLLWWSRQPPAGNPEGFLTSWAAEQPAEPACGDVDPADAFLYMGGEELGRLARRCAPDMNK